MIAAVLSRAKALMRRLSLAAGGLKSMNWGTFGRCATVCLLLPILAATSLYAAGWVGYLLGWLTGASRSPVAPLVAPLVFGLLAILGIKESARHRYVRPAAVWRGIFVAAMVIVFCFACSNGVRWGNLSRVGPYKPMSLLLGDTWEKVDAETAAELYRFRFLARQKEVSFEEFEGFVTNVVLPILEDDQPDKPARIKKALAEVEPIISKFESPTGSAKPNESTKQSG